MAPSKQVSHLPVPPKITPSELPPTLRACLRGPRPCLREHIPINRAKPLQNSGSPGAALHPGVLGPLHVREAGALMLGLLHAFDHDQPVVVREH